MTAIDMGTSGSMGDFVPDKGLSLSTKKLVFEQTCNKSATVIPSRETLPVLKNFLFEAVDGTLKVVATDLELSVIASSQIVSIEREGRVIFPARKMLDILREASEDDMSIDVVGKRATIKVGSTEWTLILPPPEEEYPELPEVSDAEMHQIERERFLTAINSVWHAAAKEPTRANLMLINVEHEKMTACDGVRFQQASLPGFPLDMQIPIGAVTDLVKLLKAANGVETIGIGATEHHLVFRVGGDTFIANKLMSQFPDMEALLLRPALSNKHELILDRDELTHAVKRVRINADQETSAIALELSENLVTLVSKDVLGNRASQPISAGWSGPDRLLCVNHQYLVDMLKMHEGASCHFWLGDDGKSRKSTVMLKDETTDTTGIISQMRSDWIMDER